MSRELRKIAPFPITQPNLTLTRPQSSSKQRCRQLTQASATGWKKVREPFSLSHHPFLPHVNAVHIMEKAWDESATLLVLTFL